MAGIMSSAAVPSMTDECDMHYAKSYRPFELFVNENYKL